MEVIDSPWFGNPNEGDQKHLKDETEYEIERVGMNVDSHQSYRGLTTQVSMNVDSHQIYKGLKFRVGQEIVTEVAIGFLKIKDWKS